MVPMVLCGVLVVVLLGASPARPHEAVDAASADRLLARVATLKAIIAAPGDPESRAAAFYDVGDAVAQITTLLNRDRAAHGGMSGTVALAVLAQLKSWDITLSASEAAHRFGQYVYPFEAYVRLAPNGQRRNEALMRILQGRFYDSFVDDPMKALDPSWPGLLAQIELAEAILSACEACPERTEVAFIRAVEYARAARMAPRTTLGRYYRERALAALAAYRKSYPGDLHAAAAAALRDRVLTRE